MNIAESIVGLSTREALSRCLCEGVAVEKNKTDTWVTYTFMDGSELSLSRGVFQVA